MAPVVTLTSTPAFCQRAGCYRNANVSAENPTHAVGLQHWTSKCADGTYWALTSPWAAVHGPLLWARMQYPTIYKRIVAASTDITGSTCGSSEHEAAPQMGAVGGLPDQVQCALGVLCMRPCLHRGAVVCQAHTVGAIHRWVIGLLRSALCMEHVRNKKTLEGQ